MERNYKLNHQLIAYILLLILWLQGCTKSSSPPIPGVKAYIADLLKLSKPSSTKQLLYQELKLKIVHLVTLHKESRNLQAYILNIKEPNCFIKRPRTKEFGSIQLPSAKLDKAYILKFLHNLVKRLLTHKLCPSSARRLLYAGK